ncbi:hypothetical protein LTR08_005400 [Meristemomyces frigidus]|nr:hypothetical protein LTR08_005400 [Meristemomyces frigidus]
MSTFNHSEANLEGSSATKVAADLRIFDLDSGAWPTGSRYNAAQTGATRSVRLPDGGYLSTFRVSLNNTMQQPRGKTTTSTSNAIPGLPDAGAADGVRAQVAAIYKKYQAGEGDAYFTAASLKASQILLPVSWQYMTEETRTGEIEVALTEADSPECPDAASASIRSTVDQLCELGAIQVELAAEDESDEDASTTSIPAKLVSETTGTLNDLTMSGMSYYNHRRHLLLNDVFTILEACVPFDHKIYIAAMAVMIWPTTDFTTKSAALNSFIAAHETYLASVMGEIPHADEEAPLLGLSGMDDYTPSVYDNNTARAILERPHRKVAPKDDDVEYVQANWSFFKNRVFEAFGTLPRDASDFQQKQWRLWQDFLAKDKVNFESLDAMAWTIYQQCMKLHQEGCVLQGRDDWCSKNADDQDLTCSERLESIIQALGHKYAAIDCLNRQQLLRLVAAPNEVVKSKLASLRSNEGRAANEKAKGGKKDVRKQVEDSDHEGAEQHA